MADGTPTPAFNPFEQDEEEKPAGAIPVPAVDPFAGATPAPSGKRDALRAGAIKAKAALTAGLPYGIQKAGVGTLTPEEETRYKRELQDAQQRSEAALPGGPRRWDDIHSVGDAAAFIGENLAYSAPQMGAVAVGTVGGALAGSFVAPGPGTVVGGGAGAVATGTPFFAGSNVDAATESGEKDLLKSQARKSLAVAPGQAALDALIGKFVPGLGKALPGPTPVPTGGLAGRVAGHTAGAAATEGVTEALQQVGERYASEESLTSPEALAEYRDAAITGAAVGGTIGGASAPFVSNNQSQLDPERPTGDVDVDLPPEERPKPQSDRPPIEPGAQGDLFTLDDVLDTGIAPVETAGNAQQTSKAGAVGKYQLLPSTAKAMAQRLGLKFDEEKLLKDDKYNRQLAREYLRTLAERYDGDMFLAVTAYHAGEGNVDAWRKRFAYDPADRQAFVDQIAKAGNVRSAAYPQKVLAAMGRQEFGSAAPADFGPPAEVDDYDLSQGAIVAQLRAATMDDLGNAAPADKGMLALSSKLSTALAAADVDSAAKAVERERSKLAKAVEELANEQTALAEGKAQHTPEEQERYQAGLDARLTRLVQQDRIIDAADALIQRFTASLNVSQPDLFAAPPAQPEQAATSPRGDALPQTAQPPSLITDPGPSQRFGRRPTMPGEPHPTGLTAEDTFLATDLKGLDANSKARTGILDQVLADPTTRTPLNRFIARLKRIGLDPTPTPEEVQRIAEFEDRMEPFVPDESGNFGIPERADAPTVAAPVAAPEPAPAAPEPAVEEKVTGNVRTRAEARADTLGSSQRAWFLRGVDQALGETDAVAPTQPSRARWFKMGQDFVAEERAAQEREQGVQKPKAAAKPSRGDQIKAAVAKRKAEPEPVTGKAPLSRGSRSDFLRAVDKAVGTRITKTQAQQLLALEGMEDEVGGRTAKLTPTRELWNLFDEAVAYNDDRGGISDDKVGLPSEKPAGRFSLSRQGQGESPAVQQQQRWRRILRQELDRMGLQDVQLFVTPRTGMYVTYGGHVDGIFLNAAESGGLGQMIDVAFDQGDPLHTLHHEAIHALREMNLFTPAEWAALERAAKADRELDWVDRVYKGLPAEDILEERVAELYAKWMHASEARMRASLAAPGSLVARALAKIKKFLGALRNAFTAAGFKDATDVMASIEAGVIGARERGPTLADLGRKSPGRPKLPQPSQKAARAIQVTVEDTVKKGHAWLAFTEDLANMAKKYIPSAGKLIDLHSRNFALSREFEERLLEIKKAYEGLEPRLKGTGKGSISELLYDSRMAGKWGFMPEYQPKAEVDPALKRRFDAMPKAAQDVVRAVFRFNFDARNQLYRATVSAVDAEYDPLIEAAGTTEQKDAIRADKARALAHFSRVFDTRDGQPYTPLKREGQWVVVGRSDAYMEAKRAGDQAKMDELRSDPEHYFVDFRDTAAEADALRQNVAVKFGRQNTSFFERNDVPDAEVGGKELHMAFQQLKAAVEGEAKANPGSKAAKELHRLAVDLYLHTLADSSARKGELSAELVPARDPVTGEVLDMMRAFVTRSQATTHYIASISNNAEIQQALQAMRTELSAVEGDARTDAARFYNELVWRYAKNMGMQPSRFVDKITRGVSIFNLLLSPFYYLQNATQAVLLSQPLVAAKAGYAPAMAEFNKAYGDFAILAKGVDITDRIDFRKAPADVRDVIRRLAERGRLDAGFAMELGAWEMNGNGVLPTTVNRLDRFLRMAPQRVEVMNRVVTGIAAYRAALKKGDSQEAAFEFASKVIYDSHGDYSGFNAPKPFAAMGNWGKVVLQFRKFQFIMASLVAKEFHHTFKGASKAERMAGAKALAFIAAHMAAVGGIVGQPAAALFGPMVMSVLNALDEDDDKDFGNWKEELRKFLGAGGEGDDRSWLADLIFKGAPYALLDADTSERLGMGNMLALAPYAELSDAAKDRDSLFKTMGVVLSGAFGGLIAKGVDAWGYARQDELDRALETISPGVVGGTLKAMRQAAEGLQNRSGDVLVRPEDISGLEAFYTAMGVAPRDLANQRDRAALTYRAREHYDGKTTLIKRRYAAAVRAGDTAKVKAIREEWDALQAARERDGFKKQPLSTLLRAPREQERREDRVIGGVSTTPANRGFVESLVEDETP